MSEPLYAICSICPQISAKEHKYHFEVYPAIICGICGQTPLLAEFRVDTEASIDDLFIHLGMGDWGKTGKIHLAAESSCPAGPATA